MKTLIIIIGLVILSETAAQAANRRTEDRAIHYLENGSSISCNTAQQASSKAGETETGITNDGSSTTRDIRLILTENEPPKPDRGNPDNRGGGTR